MVYDIFSFNNELELLEIRLNHHSQIVDKFVLTESKYTYSGKLKPLYYDEVKNKYPFVNFKDRIIHNIFDLPPNNNENWKYEFLQRNSILRYLHIFTDEDIFLYLDCDEIVRSKKVIEAANKIFKINDDIINLEMIFNWYYFNCIIDPKSEFQYDYSMEECFKHNWHMGKIIRKKHFFEFFNNLYEIRTYNIWSPENMNTIINSGWHFSNLGSAESILNKLNSFSHSNELNEKYKLTKKRIEKRKQKLLDPLGRKVKFIITPLDVPEYVIKNKEKYEQFIFKV